METTVTRHLAMPVSLLSWTSLEEWLTTALKARRGHGLYSRALPGLPVENSPPICLAAVTRLGGACGRQRSEARPGCGGGTREGALDGPGGGAAALRGAMEPRWRPDCSQLTSSHACYRGDGGARTLTVSVLSALPLPVGLRPRDHSTATVRHQFQHLRAPFAAPSRDQNSCSSAG